MNRSDLTVALRRFVRDERAATLVEFTVAVPVLLLLLLGILEFSALQIARIKADKASYMIGSIITQLNRAEQSTTTPSYFTVDSAQVDAVLDRLDRIVPRSTRLGTKVVVSAFTYADRVFPAGATTPQPVNAPLLLWAKGRVFGDIPDNSASTVSVLGSNVNWPSAIQMSTVTFNDTYTQNAITNYGNFRCPEHVVLVEVFYDYTPIFGLLQDMRFIERRTLASRAFLRPRTGDIEAIAGDVSFNMPAESYRNTKARGGFCS